MMEVLTFRIRAGQPQDRILHLEFSAGQPGILTVAEQTGRKLIEANWYCWKLGSDFGNAVRLERFFSERRPGEPVQYDVLIDGEASSCDCLGFCAHGRCRHIAAVRALQEHGDI